ncbi:PilW family protein [Bacillus sp. FJAT-29937]|uniref:PilW family protein n=1 Tax=Bacillus sp. FJAT-29937 TaxID=1720553 RepID=UPI00082E4E48|nr:prepilin-type N-terminal cleavage/methylation domain-containing protein [Bacillus sp. FJAT-29937]
MNNQRGFTLVELLATITILALIITLLSSILIDGKKAYNRNTTNQLLQQEANYITEIVRREYLRKYDEGKMSNPIKLSVQDNILKMDGKVISEGFNYIVLNVSRKSNPVHFYLELEKDGLTYTVETTFSKLN